MTQNPYNFLQEAIKRQAKASREFKAFKNSDEVVLKREGMDRAEEMLYS